MNPSSGVWILLSFSLGVIFGVFGSNSIYYFLSFLIFELIYFLWNRKYDLIYRLNIIFSSIFGYIIARALISECLFNDSEQ
jgi:hypothetical protein